MTRPLWFMDVDEVLNFFPDDPTTAFLNGAHMFKASPNRWPGMSDEDKMNAEWKPGGLRRYRIIHDPTLTDRIKDLHVSGRVEVVWLTSWGSGANGELRAGLGWPAMKVAGEPRYRMSGLQHRDLNYRWWKWNDLHAYLENTRNPDSWPPFVWTDDHLAFETQAVEWARGIGGFPVATDGVTGLTHDQVDEIEEYLESVVQLEGNGVK